MADALLPLVHFAHVLVAAGWAGATLFCGLVLFPLIAGLDPAAAGDLFDRVRRPIAAGLGSVAGLTYLLGLARAWVGGGLSGVADLLTPYAALVLGAVLVMMGIEHLGGRLRRRLPGLLENPDRFRAEAPALARRTGLMQAGLMALLVGLMVAMGLALY